LNALRRVGRSYATIDAVVAGVIAADEGLATTTAALVDYVAALRDDGGVGVGSGGGGGGVIARIKFAATAPRPSSADSKSRNTDGNGDGGDGDGDGGICDGRGRRRSQARLRVDALLSAAADTESAAVAFVERLSAGTQCGAALLSHVSALDADAKNLFSDSNSNCFVDNDDVNAVVSAEQRTAIVGNDAAPIPEAIFVAALRRLHAESLALRQVCLLYLI
jgi:hypothetical protein